jgi:hypothetical protein
MSGLQTLRPERFSREGLEENLEFALIVAPDWRGVKNLVQSAVSNCRLSLLFKMLHFRLGRPRRFRRITVETERTFIFRSFDRFRVGWCQECGAEVELMSVGDAANVTGMSELAIYQLIESGDLHFIEDANHIVVCLSSLLWLSADIKTPRSRSERILEGRVQENESDLNNRNLG